MGDDTIGTRLHGELNERLVVRVLQYRLPAMRQRPFFRAGANGVEQLVHIIQTQTEFLAAGLQDFLILMDKVIAQDRSPFANSETAEDFK